MADDNSARYRSTDPSGRGPAPATPPAAPASDPLAELARLIGRNDPFSEYGREARPAAQPAPPAPDADARYGGNAAASYGSSLPPPQFGGEPAQPYASEPAPPRYASEPVLPRFGAEPAQPYGHDAAPRYAADHPPRTYDEQSSHDNWPGLPAPPVYPSNDPFALPSSPPYLPRTAPHYDHQGYASPPYADPHGRLPTDSYQPEHGGFDAAGYPAAPDQQSLDRQGYAPPLYPHEPEAGGMPAPHDDEFYDDEPRGGRRKGLLTVVAVLGLAVIGTAGAFGYRSLFGGAGSSGPPPVIRASGEPSKVAPPPAVADQSASKFSYDRFGDAGKDEQVVRREEKPVDLSKAAPPRTVFPGAPVANSPSTKPAGTTTTAANPPSAIGEPRRVRTVPIRPDQGGDAAAAAPVQQPLSSAPPRQANAAASGAAPAPDDSPAARAAASRASSRTALRSAPPAAPAANAPLSLSPDASNNALPPPAAQDNFPPPPRPSAPPPARVASAPAARAAAAGGSYLVQVSSQRSEADAENAYRGLQSKYSSVLGGHPHQVRRADLGTKGVYYRTMVGPFASREEAVQVCSSLKQAGGDCVVQH